MKVIAVANQKGGVAKTATAAALASVFKQKGYRVLVLDMDPQGSLSKQALGQKVQGQEMYQVLKGDSPIRDAIVQMPQFDIVPTGIVLAGLENELVMDVGKFYKLRDAIQEGKLEELYDFVFVDTPPSLGLHTTNALVASDGILVPTDADCDSINGVVQLSETVHNVKKYLKDVNTDFIGIAFTKFDSRQNNSKVMMDLAVRVAEVLGTQVFHTCIRNAVAIREAKSRTQDLVASAPSSNVVQDYAALANEILVESKKGRF